MCWPRAIPLFLALGCGAKSAPPTKVSFSGSPLTTLTGTAGESLSVRSSPSPPTQGAMAFQYTVTDASGTPVTGLDVTVQPWMPAMGHGSSIAPSVTETSPGVYEVDQVYFAMAGTWQLRTQLSGSASDSFVPTFQIP